MTSILLTGIPGVGKTDLVQITAELSRRYYEKNVRSVSLGAILVEGAQKLLGTAPGSISRISYTHQRLLRWGLIPRAILELKRTTEEHVIVDTPMTMYVHEGVIPDIIFSGADIAGLNEGRTIDYIVTLIEDPHIVAPWLEGTVYPREIQTILEWMGMEVAATSTVSSHVNSNSDRESGPRHLVIPRKHSDDTLVKLLNDQQPTVCYLAMPLTRLVVNEGDGSRERLRKVRARERIDAFRKRLQEYAVVTSPIELGDIVPTSVQSKHTVFRDIHWFVNGADIMIAYFPDNYESTGVPEEMRETLRSGKPVILIHPQYKGKGEVFGVEPTLHFRSDEEFFKAVDTARTDPSCTEKKYDILKRFLDPRQNVPRYAHLRPYAVAVDIHDEKNDKHLLIQQGRDKDFAGKWMLLAGKKEIGQTDFRALYDEAWQELGILLLETDVEKEHSLYPVDYAHPQFDNVLPRYVRIYRASRVPRQGKLRGNNFTTRDEVGDVRWFSAREILKMKNRLVPATHAYFADRYGGKK